MNRRNFLHTLGAAVASFTILPSATLYERPKWKKSEAGIYVINPAWTKAEYEFSWIVSVEYSKLIELGPYPYNAGETVRL